MDIYTKYSDFPKRFLHYRLYPFKDNLALEVWEGTIRDKGFSDWIVLEY